MGNCLVTKLKESVQNEELMTINGIKINCEKMPVMEFPSYQCRITYRANTGTKVHTTKNGYFATSLENLDIEENRMTSDTTIDGGNNLRYFANDNYSFIIEDKYDLYYWIKPLGYGSVLHINIDDLATNTSMYGFSDDETEGHIQSFSNNTEMENLVVGGKISGNVNLLSNLSSLVTFSIFNQPDNVDVTGSLETLLSTMWTNRKSGTMAIDFRNTLITFNSQTATRLYYTAEFDNSGCVIKENGTTVASYNGSTWTYNN